MPGGLVRREETQIHTVGRGPHEDEGRDWCVAAAGQGLPVTPEHKRKAWNRVSPSSFRDSMALLRPLVSDF